MSTLVVLWRGTSRHIKRSAKNFQNTKSYVLGGQSIRTIQLEVNGYHYTDYELERKCFSLQTPDYFNFATDFIDEWAHLERAGIRKTSTPAFWWVDSELQQELKLSFDELSDISKRVANALVGGLKLKRGDRLIVILPKVPEWWYINLACIRADITVIPGTTLLKAADIKHRLELSHAKCIITDPDHADDIDEAAEGCETLESKVVVGSRSETRPGWWNYDTLVEKSNDHFKSVNTRARDPMMIFFTSGTTGSPKMAEHTHASYGLGHILSSRYWLMLNPESMVWNLSDTGWAKSAWSSLFSPWIHGAGVFVHGSPKFDPGMILKLLSTYPITHFCSSPTGLRIMQIEHVKDVKFKALERCMGAGEPVNPELMEVWRKKTGFPLYEGYGQTETTLVCCRSPSIPYRVGSMGKASPGIDVAIVDNDGNVMEPGLEGNIAIKVKPFRPIGLFARYVNEPDRTENSFRGDYYLMGDRGYMDEDNYVYFVGRADDVINSAGYRIGPFEVENALLEHPAVLESAVVSSPDEMRGEVVKAFVTLVPEYKDANKEELIVDLQNHVMTVTAPYKYPRKIEFVEDLPKTISGKIRRVELRQQEWNQTV